jgi:prepilin peptidase CpaA
MALQHYISLIVLIIAAATDIRKGLIYNWLTFPAILVGLFLALWQGGLSGLGLSFLGILVGGGVLTLLFVSGAMGAGDVKLMAALGALMGPTFVGETLIMAIIIGGIAGVCDIALQGKLLSFFRWFGKSLVSFIKPIFVKGMVRNMPKSPGFGGAPFAVCILFGAIAAHYYDVLYYLRVWL